MKLPNGDQAILDPRKITDYYLNPDHDDGKPTRRSPRLVTCYIL